MEVGSVASYRSPLIDSLEKSMGIEAELHIAVVPTTLPRSTPSPITIEAEIQNRGQQPFTVYPDACELAPQVGWTSPAFEVVIRTSDGAAVPRFRLRAEYGPPPMPPTGEWFEDRAEQVESRDQFQREISGCWLPPTTLAPVHTDRATLDPEGMDELPEGGFPRHSVLVLDSDCPVLWEEREHRTDFLRPNLVYFLPEDDAYRLKLRIVQEPWDGFFEPATELAISSDWINLAVAD